MDYTSILGIDVSSDKIDLCYQKGSGRIGNYELNYTEDSIDSFLKNHPEIAPKHCLVGLESTGDYHLKATRHFLKKGFKVKVLNPILTKQYIRTTIRGIKTDKTDSELICRLIQDGHGEYISLEQLKNEDKEYLRLSDKVKVYAKALRAKNESLTRKSIKNNRLEGRLKNIILELEELSDDLVHKATIDRSKEEELIDSIPGFAVKLSAIVFNELGDITRFKNSKSLIAYAGLDPKVKQSGKSLNTFGKLTKRGSPYLRSALFLAANVARIHDPELARYYQKKKNENRSYKEIMCMIARKLLTRIYTVLTEQRPYVIRK